MDNSESNKIHELKTWPEFFSEIIKGSKTHDLRKNDRDFQVNDYLYLREYNPNKKEYTGREVYVKVTYLTSKNIPCAESQEALSNDYVILSIKKVEKTTAKTVEEKIKQRA